MTVAAVNDAPVLNATKSPALNAVAANAAAPAGAVGTLISKLVDFATPTGQVDNVTDVDKNPLLGIAITAAATANGSWFYSVNNGSTWLALGAVGNASARLLAADSGTRLYFRPNANFRGTVPAAITFRAWDRTLGANGSLQNSTSGGGATAFSSATDTASISVT
jgi:hypothetical protein